MTKSKIIAVITAATGIRVIVGSAEIKHVTEEHFQFLPVDILLELLERILKQPTAVFQERSTQLYHLFYRLENSKYLVAVIKTVKSGNYFCTLYPTGSKIRNKHKKLKRIKI